MCSMSTSNPNERACLIYRRHHWLYHWLSGSSFEQVVIYSLQAVAYIIPAYFPPSCADLAVTSGPIINTNKSPAILLAPPNGIRRCTVEPLRMERKAAKKAIKNARKTAELWEREKQKTRRRKWRQWRRRRRRWPCYELEQKWEVGLWIGMRKRKVGK